MLAKTLFIDMKGVFDYISKINLFRKILVSDINRDLIS